MARIRTIKPEFWEDETIGLLTPHARLLFIATWNLADDEGLLRWSPAYVKASVFMYDDLDIDAVKTVMAELTDFGLVFPYIGGRARQELACVVNFRRHQKINRPQPGKLPPPSAQNGDVARMYAERDGWTCHLCGREINQPGLKDERYNLSLDHITPQSEGGSDYPSNIAAAHLTCNKARRDKDVGEARRALTERRTQDRSSPPLSNAVNDSVNGSVNGSLPEGKGREQGTGKGTGKGRTSSAPDGADHDRNTPAPQRRVQEHPDARRLCQLLADHVEDITGKAPYVEDPPKAWLDSARLLVTADKNTPEQVEWLIRWVAGHHFWRAQILSMPTLRKQQLKLIAQIRNGDSGSGNRRQDDLDRARQDSMNELLGAGGAL